MAAITTAAASLLSATTNINVSAAGAPSANQVLTATSSTAATWQNAPGSADGWTSISVTLTYSSVDGHTFVVSSSADLTASIGLGDRIKFTNNATTFYGIVTAITTTTITLYGGTQYSVANSAITAPYYSHIKNPFGFDTRADYWTEELSNAVEEVTSSPTASTWYNSGSLSLAVPIGAWKLYYSAIASVNSTASGNADLDVRVALSTSNTSVSDTQLETLAYQKPQNTIILPAWREKVIALTAKTTYYLIEENTIGTTVTSIEFRGDMAPSIIRAVCNYL